MSMGLKGQEGRCGLLAWIPSVFWAGEGWCILASLPSIKAGGRGESGAWSEFVGITQHDEGGKPRCWVALVLEATRYSWVFGERALKFQL